MDSKERVKLRYHLISKVLFGDLDAPVFPLRGKFIPYTMDLADYDDEQQLRVAVAALLWKEIPDDQD